MNPIDDHELDRLLRDVPPATNLKAELHKIPEQSERVVIGDQQPSSSQRAYFWIAMGTAAAVILFLNYAWRTQPTSQNSQDSQLAHRNEGQISPAECLRRMDEINSEFDLVIARYHFATKKSKTLAQIGLQPMDDLDVHSLILAESARTGMQFGLTADAVRKDLVSITQRFPDTEGAFVAQQMLNQSDVN
jgi:hypothetical protein